jgi:hypothetical protein
MMRHLLLCACVALLAFGLAACDKTAPLALLLGMTDRPPARAVMFDLACDTSRGSSCTQATLTDTLNRILPIAAERPGSTVRVWVQGSDVESTALVAQAVSTTTRRSGRRAVGDAQARWIAKTRTEIVAAVQPRFAEPTRRSPIAEALTRVAITATPAGAERWLVVLTDGLEVSEFGDLECGRVPPPKEFIRAVQRRTALTAASFRQIHVRMAHLDLSPIDRGRCRMTLARAADVRELWTAAFKAAGATDVKVGDGAPEISVVRTGEENAQ